MENQIFYQYFAYERVLGLTVEFILFTFLLMVFLKLRKSQEKDWVILLRKAVGFLVLAPVLAVCLEVFGFIALEDMFENYAALIAIVGFNIPIALSTYHFYKLAQLSNEKA